MTQIAIASGKGGTGKTTAATSLALAVADAAPVLLDCDVEAPNAHIFLQPRFDRRLEVTLPIPEVDQGRCTGCGTCAGVCQYNAIVVVCGKTLVYPQLCHGCGSCALQCPEQAIAEIPRPLGLLEAGEGLDGVRLARGTLNIGEPLAIPVIRELRRWDPFPDADLVIHDAPPGTSCPVVESVRGTDFVLLVTEPTPFGLHDLKLAVEMAGELRLPIGIVINRDGVGDDAVETYCRAQGLPILMRIPFERQFSEALARGRALVEAFPEYTPRFKDLYERIRSLIPIGEPSTRSSAYSGAKSA